VLAPLRVSRGAPPHQQKEEKKEGGGRRKKRLPACLSLYKDREAQREKLQKYGPGQGRKRGGRERVVALGDSSSCLSGTSGERLQKEPDRDGEEKEERKERRSGTPCCNLRHLSARSGRGERRGGNRIARKKGIRVCATGKSK